MRTSGRADTIECVIYVGDPVAQRLIHGVFQRACTGRNRHNLGAKQFHAEHVRLLPLDISLAHEHDTFQTETSANGGRGNAMLTGTRFGNDARLAHAFGQQDLTEAIVDLVRAGVIQLIALEIDFCAAEMLCQALSKIKR